MPSPLKDLYSPSFYSRLSDSLTDVLPGFEKQKFTEQIYTPAFDGMELKQRMRHTVITLHNFMPADFKDGVIVIKELITLLRKQGIGEDGLAHMFLPDYIEVYGIDDYNTSIDALEFTTQFVSCEFAVRPFLLKYTEPMMAQILAWSKHENYKVRRLASEGSRPRLPWAMAVPALKKDASLILPILENLKNDPSEWVRRSVANNLNDIAKDFPEIVLDIAARWTGISKETDAIIKHGSRTLLKQGHTEILAHYGLHTNGIELSNFKVLTSKISIGDSVEFAFTVANTNSAEQKIRLEYAIFYPMKNGKFSKKVYKISERIFAPKETSTIKRKQKFIPITTRTFYAGLHKVTLIINGEEKVTGEFELDKA
jgi:3-methyladenine DNA glycosylase AlkC